MVSEDLRKAVDVEWGQVHDFLLDLGSCRIASDFSYRLLPALRDLVPFDRGVAAWVGANGRLSHLSSVGFPVAQIRTDMHLYIQTINLRCCREVFCSSDSIPVHRRCEVEASNVLLSAFASYGVEHLAGFLLTDDSRLLGAVAVCRDLEEDPFLASDLAVFSIIRSHLSNLYANLLTETTSAGSRGGGDTDTREQVSAASDDLDLSNLGQLTNREKEIAFLICQGRSTESIAESLSISPLTVKKHVSNILDKAKVTSRHELTAKLFKQAVSEMWLTQAIDSKREGLDRD